MTQAVSHWPPITASKMIKAANAPKSTTSVVISWRELNRALGLAIVCAVMVLASPSSRQRYPFILLTGLLDTVDGSRDDGRSHKQQHKRLDERDDIFADAAAQFHQIC